jgi:hypothetical protein
MLEFVEYCQMYYMFMSSDVDWLAHSWTSVKAI